MRKKENPPSLVFSQEAKKLFVKELSDVGFDFYQFLILKKALKLNGNRFVVLEYDAPDLQDAYRKRFIEKTPYYLMDMVGVSLEHPFSFWNELRSQASKEESNEFWRIENEENIRTGKTHNARVLETIGSIKNLNKSI